MHFLKPNTTAHIQPCDQGIIRTFKSKYRRNQIKSCIKKIDESDELIMPDMKEAIFFIKDAWINVSKETIANCWRKAGDYLVFYILLKYLFFD